MKQSSWDDLQLTLDTDMTKRQAEELSYCQAHGNDDEVVIAWWEYGGMLKSMEGRRLTRSWYCLVMWYL